MVFEIDRNAGMAWRGHECHSRRRSASRSDDQAQDEQLTSG